MTARIVGIDCYSQLTDAILAHATSRIGQSPSFCGRYFTSPTTVGGAEYRRRKESMVFRRNNVLVLPIGRQTTHVGGTFTTGQHDGIANASDLVASFGSEYLSGIGGRFRIYLDTEGDDSSHLSKSYWKGWSDGLKRAVTSVEFLPCIYGLPGDFVTWNALQKAIEEGSPCYGSWLSRPYNTGSVQEPVQWNSKALSAFPLKDVDVQIHQYMFANVAQKELFDRNLLNPNLADASEFLKTLIRPPEM
jgi:hypothetical protein